MTGPLLALIGLGAFHGLNPGMGWLFAVAIGFQERSRGALLRALGPIALGHALSVAAAAVLVTLTQTVVAASVIAIVGGVLLVGFGLYRLLSKRHFRWVGMKLSAWQLTSWSFLMSSVHGAGLMLLPVLIGTSLSGNPHAGHGGSALASISGPVDGATGVIGGIVRALVVTGIHTVAMVAVAGAIAILVYQVVGLRILRSAWINLDRVWAIALIGAGAATVVSAAV